MSDFKFCISLFWKRLVKTIYLIATSVFDGNHLSKLCNTISYFKYYTVLVKNTCQNYTCISYFKCCRNLYWKTLVKTMYILLQVLHQVLVENTYQNSVIVYLTSSAATVFNVKHLSKLCTFYVKCYISFSWKTLDKAMYLLVQIKNISGIKTARERYLGETYQDEVVKNTCSTCSVTRIHPVALKPTPLPTLNLINRRKLHHISTSQPKLSVKVRSLNSQNKRDTNL